MKEINFKKEEIYAIRKAVYDQFMIEHEKDHDHFSEFLKSGFEKLGEILIAAEEGESSKVTITELKPKKN